MCEFRAFPKPQIGFPIRDALLIPRYKARQVEPGDGRVLMVYLVHIKVQVDVLEKGTELVVVRPVDYVARRESMVDIVL